MNNYSHNQIFIQNKKPRQLVFKKKIKLPHRGGWSGVRFINPLLLTQQH